VLSGPGLRLAEAAALDVDDVPTTERTGAVHVRAGKRERPRTVPLPADARSLLRCWLTERAQHPAARRGEPALWLGRRGRLSARQLQRIAAELGADARLVDVSAHTLRHTAATRWLRAGVDVVVVAGLLGHASLDTTRTYALPTDRELAAAVEAAAVEAAAVEYWSSRDPRQPPRPRRQSRA
jgi:site-specific recombinase XerD